MLISMLIILLSASLQWTRSNGVSTAIDTTSSLINTTSPSIITSESLHKTVATGKAPAVSLTSPIVTSTNATTNGSVPESESNSTTPGPPTTVSGKSASSETPTTSSDWSTNTESYASTVSVRSLEPRSNNFTTPTYTVNFTAMISTTETQMKSTTVPPTTKLPNESTTLSTTKSNSATTDLSISVKPTSMHPNLTNNSAESREPQKDNHNKGGTVFGAIVGAVLGCALISLVGYFICGKRKPKSFAHQRLYDDTRNDPVLRLDNTPELYDANFGDLSYYSPTSTTETMSQNDKDKPYDTIPMDDMTSSQP